MGMPGDLPLNLTWPMSWRAACSELMLFPWTWELRNRTWLDSQLGTSWIWSAELTFHRGRTRHKRKQPYRGSYIVSRAHSGVTGMYCLRSSILSPFCSNDMDPESSTRTTTSNRLILTRSAASSTGSFQAEASCWRDPDWATR